MKSTDRTHNQKKIETIQKISHLSRQFPVIAITKLYKVRAAQMMTLRKNFKVEMTIFVAKNRLTCMALKKMGLENIDSFIKELKGQTALIFTNINPFKLSMMLEKNAVLLPARVGDMATDDIIIPAGNTGIPPGPVLSDFKGVGVPTRIDTGSIWVAKDTMVVKQGQPVETKLAGVLSRLNIKPIKAGLSIFLAYSEGLILHENDIKIDLNNFSLEIRNSQVSAINLSLFSSYATCDTVPLILIKADTNARNLALFSGYMCGETIDFILANYQHQAYILYNLLKNKGYT